MPELNVSNTWRNIFLQNSQHSCFFFSFQILAHGIGSRSDWNKSLNGYHNMGTWFTFLAFFLLQVSCTAHIFRSGHKIFAERYFYFLLFFSPNIEISFQARRRLLHSFKNIFSIFPFIRLYPHFTLMPFANTLLLFFANSF